MLYRKTGFSCDLVQTTKSVEKHQRRLCPKMSSRLPLLYIKPFGTKTALVRFDQIPAIILPFCNNALVPGFFRIWATTTDLFPTFSQYWLWLFHRFGSLRLFVSHSSCVNKCEETVTVGCAQLLFVCDYVNDYSTYTSTLRIFFISQNTLS